MIDVTIKKKKKLNQYIIKINEWYGMVWYGMVWYGMVWYGMVWYGMVWYGMVWCLFIQYQRTSYIAQITQDAERELHEV